jgi:CBS domain-containing protein
MKAVDVMTREVVTVRPETPVAEVVSLLIKHDVSALPVVGEDRHILGIVSEADLLRRVEIGTEGHSGG